MTRGACVPFGVFTSLPRLTKRGNSGFVLLHNCFTGHEPGWGHRNISLWKGVCSWFRLHVLTTFGKFQWTSSQQLKGNFCINTSAENAGWPPFPPDLRHFTEPEWHADGAFETPSQLPPRLHIKWFCCFYLVQQMRMLNRENGHDSTLLCPADNKKCFVHCQRQAQERNGTVEISHTQMAPLL